MHGRTYKQAFNGNADFTGIYELKQALNIPVIGNGDVMSYDDGIAKIQSPNPDDANLDGFMIGRASFGNPWCFLAGEYVPTLSEILSVMTRH